MACNSKKKGKTGELEFSNKCKEKGYKTERSQQYCGRKAEADDVIGLDGIFIEVKRVQALNLDKTMEKAIEDNVNNKKIIIAHRKDRKKWKVTMELDDWFELYEAWRVNNV